MLFEVVEGLDRKGGYRRKGGCKRSVAEKCGKKSWLQQRSLGRQIWDTEGDKKKKKGYEKRQGREGARGRVFQRVFRRVFFGSLSRVAGREKLLERAETCFIFA